MILKELWDTLIRLLVNKQKIGDKGVAYAMEDKDQSDTKGERGEVIWLKKNPDDVIWWKAIKGANDNCQGEMIFSFDKKKEFNFFEKNLKEKLTYEQIEILRKERPLLAGLRF